MPSQTDKQDARYYPYHRGTLEKCLTFRRFFHKQLKVEGIIFQNEGDFNVHERPFPNHNNDRGKWQVMMVSAIEKDTEEDVRMQPEGKPDLNKMAQWIQNLFMFKH